MSNTMRASPKFVRAFAAVHEAFASSADEIEEAKAVARANMVAAQDSYYASAEMIEAGWDPLLEQASAFLARTGFVPESRWPVTQPESVAIRWPSLSLKAAA
jgi:hypothetical protein